MIIALLGNLDSIHLQKWANAFAENGHTVHAISMKLPNVPLSPKVIIHQLPYQTPIGYFANASQLRKLLQQINPHVLNAHYASGYGTLARLSRFHPCVLSVWGSDVYDFPHTSFLHKHLLTKNLRNADALCSTSRVMAEETHKFLSKPQKIHITPFGVDTTVFKPEPRPVDGLIHIGTVKTLDEKYGIDTLIQTFSHLRKLLQSQFHFELYDKVRLDIYGDGPDKDVLKALAISLDLTEVCSFHGSINHSFVPQALNSLDIFVALSRLDSESFGVAVVEASACGLPVVVSNAGGLPEVVQEDFSGYIVPKENPEATAEILYKLLLSAELRKKLGSQGRQRVLDLFDWKKNYFSLDDVLQSFVKEDDSL